MGFKPFDPVIIFAMSKEAALFKMPGYKRMWLSLLLSNLGAQITMIALPLTAVFLLHATPFEMGILTAMEVIPFVLLSLPSGVWLDRRRKFPIFIAGEFILGLLVLSVPLAWVLGFLRMPMLYVVSVAIGAVYTVAGSASQIVLTQLVGRENLVRAHAQNAIASSAAEVLGPGLAGLLIKVWGAPLALLMNSILLIGSVTMLKGIRINEKRPPPSAIPFWKEMKLGLDFVHQTRLLKEIAWTMGGWHFFAEMALSIQIIFAINDLALEQNVVSLSYVAIGLGSILGGFMGPRFSKYIGPGPGLLTGIAITSVGWLIASCLQNWLSHMVLFSSMLFSYSFGATFMFINFLSIRQGITPSHMLGRMTATMRWYSLLPAGPGALLGGWTAEHYGMTWAIGLAGIGTLSVALIATWRPYLRVLRTLPQPYVAISEN